MTTSIYYDRIASMYAIEVNDQIVGHAETYHDAEVQLSSIREAKHSAIMGGDSLLIEAGRFAQDGRADLWANGVRNYETEPTFASRYIAPMFEDVPLLAQCAALLDSLLGGPVVGGGILDELRRVRAALRKEGW